MLAFVALNTLEHTQGKLGDKAIHNSLSANTNVHRLLQIMTVTSMTVTMGYGAAHYGANMRVSNMHV
jgi:hypothetical protein